jgi:hypothetical protein
MNQTRHHSKRVKCSTPTKQRGCSKPDVSTIQSSAFEETEGTFTGEVNDQDDNRNSLLTQPAMIETYESPTHRASAKKPKATQSHGIMNYFKPAIEVITKALTPNRFKSKSSPSASHTTQLSASCLGRGDEEVERCFDDTSSKQSSNSNGFQLHEKQHSPTKRKAEDIAPDVSVSVSVAKVPEAEPRKIACLTAARDPTMSWAEMELQMKDDGLKHLSGTGLSSYWWVHPTYAGMKKNDIVKQCKEGEDYFTSTESLQLYAKNKLGWGGEIESEAPEGKRRRTEPLRINPSPKRVAEEEASSPSKKARRAPKAKTDKSVASQTNDSASSDILICDGSECLPDKESKMSDKLEAALLTLCKNWTGGYCSVSTKTSEIIEFMASPVADFADGTDFAPRTGFLYVCGRPGTGKVRHNLEPIIY